MGSSENVTTGVLVLRIWREAADGTLRVRVTSNIDITSDQDETAVFLTVDEALARVRNWISNVAPKPGT